MENIEMYMMYGCIVICVFVLITALHYAMTGHLFKTGYMVKYHFYSISKKATPFPYRGYVKHWFVPYWIRECEFETGQQSERWINSFYKQKIQSVVSKQI